MFPLLLMVVLLMLTAACSGQKEQSTSSLALDTAALEATPYDALPDGVRLAMDEPFTGDLDVLVRRRAIRVAVTFNRTHYFVDGGRERGLTYEWMKLLEDDLNRDLKTGNLKVHVVMIPMPRDQLYPALITGKVDMVAAMLTVTPEREKLVAFSDPTRTNVNQVLVTGPGAPAITSLDDLAGRRVFVRKGSLYHEALLRVSADLESKGKPPVVIDEAPPILEDDDVLEMVNAGLAPMTIVDDYLAEFWSQVLKNITVHPGITVRSGGTLAVAFRKENPRLREVVNGSVKKHGEGEAIRRVLERRYLENTTYVKNAASSAERRKFQAVVDLFRKYGDRYELDYLLMAAQGYQESTLDHKAVSRVGAIGIMQVMPATGKEMNVGDIRKIEANIHAGVKYMRFVMDRYYKDEDMDSLNKALMAFASYNAGPARVRQLRALAAKRGLDPNVWFGNVERIASDQIGRETVTYVSNIYKYYVAYRLLSAQRDQRDAAREEVKAGK